MSKHSAEYRGRISQTYTASPPPSSVFCGWRRSGDETGLESLQCTCEIFVVVFLGAVWLCSKFPEQFPFLLVHYRWAWIWLIQCWHCSQKRLQLSTGSTSRGTEACKVIGAYEWSTCEEHPMARASVPIVQLVAPNFKLRKRVPCTCTCTRHFTTVPLATFQFPVVKKLSRISDSGSWKNRTVDLRATFQRVERSILKWFAMKCCIILLNFLPRWHLKIHGIFMWNWGNF